MAVDRDFHNHGNLHLAMSRIAITDMIDSWVWSDGGVLACRSLELLFLEASQSRTILDCTAFVTGKIHELLS